MVEYRYHRMAWNDFGWKKPSPGRLYASDDFVGHTGFGMEDWNFSPDLWSDGKLHLYLKKAPKIDGDETLNVILGAHTALGPMVVGFAENAAISNATLPADVWRRRAVDLGQLDAKGQLGKEWSDLTTKQRAQKLRADERIYWLALESSDLLMIDAPVVLPQKIYEVSTSRYLPLSVTPEQYFEIKEYVQTQSPLASAAGEGFPEGALVERRHLARERNSRLTRNFLEIFFARQNNYYCEACNDRPSDRYGVAPDEVGVLEVHHDVPLSDPNHGGMTRIEDLKLVCPNCHRMIHKTRPWLRVADLKAKVRAR